MWYYSRAVAAYRWAQVMEIHVQCISRAYSTQKPKTEPKGLSFLDHLFSWKHRHVQFILISMSLNHQVVFQSLSLRNPADWLMDVLSGVVPNDKLTDFRPAMLFDIWKSKKDGISRQGIFETQQLESAPPTTPLDRGHAITRW